MATTLHCDIVSAEKSIFSGSVEMIVATGVLGDLGIVPGHAALLTQLIPGPVKLTMEGGTEEIFYVSGGFLEVQPGTATLLADTAERAAWDHPSEDGRGDAIASTSWGYRFRRSWEIASEEDCEG